MPGFTNFYLILRCPFYQKTGRCLILLQIYYILAIFNQFYRPTKSPAITYWAFVAFKPLFGITCSLRTWLLQSQNAFQ